VGVRNPAGCFARFLWTLSQADQKPRADFVSFTALPPLTPGAPDWKYFTDHLDHAGPLLQ